MAGPKFNMLAKIKDSDGIKGYLMRDISEGYLVIFNVEAAEALAYYDGIQGVKLNKSSKRLEGAGIDLRKIKTISHEQAVKMVEKPGECENTLQLEYKVKQICSDCRSKGYKRLANIVEGMHNNHPKIDGMDIGLRDAMTMQPFMRSDYQLELVQNDKVYKLVSCIKYNKNGVIKVIQPLPWMQSIDTYLMDYLMKFLVYQDIVFNGAKGLDD